MPRCAGRWGSSPNGSAPFSRLLKNIHLRRCSHPASLRRISSTPLFAGISCALRLDVFEQSAGFCDRLSRCPIGSARFRLRRQQEAQGQRQKTESPRWSFLKPRSSILFKNGRHKIGRLKGAKVIHPFSDPDEANRDAQLMGNPNDDPALGRPVHLRQDDTRDP